MQEYSSQRRPSQHVSQDPVLNAEDEAFLRNIMSESAEQPPHDAVVSPSTSEPARAADGPLSPVSPLESNATNLQSPVSPVEEFGRELGEEERKARETGAEPAQSAVEASEEQPPKAQSPVQTEKKWKPWEWIRKKTTREKKANKEETPKEASNTTQDIPTGDGNDTEAKREAEDMTDILERLNLAADNNRVFSISEETQELLQKFNLIFKDLINGVPTAYHDLEMLLTNGNNQLQKTYSDLPSFLQKLIEKLPERWTESLAPEMLAAASERAAKSGVNMENMGKAAAAAEKVGLQVPSLKELVGKPAAIVGMLRSIVAFLRARFPAVLGVNVVWSIAIFLLLFVLWYCHKRGREVRLENERLVTEEEIRKMNEELASEEQIRATETLTTTAPQGASAAEVREGVKAAQQSREAALASSSNEETKDAEAAKEAEPAKEVEAEPKDTPAKPTRTKSRMSFFGRQSSQKPVPKVEPYPGT